MNKNKFGYSLGLISILLVLRSYLFADCSGILGPKELSVLITSLNKLPDFERESKINLYDANSLGRQCLESEIKKGNPDWISLLPPIEKKFYPQIINELAPALTEALLVNQSVVLGLAQRVSDSEGMLEAVCRPYLVAEDPVEDWVRSSSLLEEAVSKSVVEKLEPYRKGCLANIQKFRQEFIKK